jgi:DNA-binding XRE family transcriptional regulator
MDASIPPEILDKLTTFGELLRYLRRRAGLTQTQLSIAVGYSDAQISRLEQNLRLPNLATVQARFLPVLRLKVLAESLVLAVSGAAIGSIAAWIAFNGNLHAVGGLVFRLAVTPSLVGLGIGFAFTLGFVGGLFPAIRAASLPVADALRPT